MKRRLFKLESLALAGLLTVSGASLSLAAFEQEQLELEGEIQQKIESILSKTLPPNSYLVTVKVEMEQKAAPASIRSRLGAGPAGGANPFLGQNRFILPGVPEKKDFVETQAAGSAETVVNTAAAETLIRKVSITVLVAPDVTPQQIHAMRDVIASAVPFNPLRGDEMDIENSPLLKAAGSAPAQEGGAGAGNGAAPPRSSGFLGSLSDRSALPLLILLAAVIVALGVLLAFLFGPMRAFLNRLLTVLPRVGEQAAYAVSNAGAKGGAAAGAPGASVSMNGHSGGGSVNGNGDRSDMPFRFIHEDQLSKLPILFRQLSATQAALVLAYLPPEWASRVLGGLPAESQTLIMGELSQAREVPPEIVKDVESQLKARLPYLVGGVDWIQSVYQLTQPQTQRALLGTLNQQSPELARQLRRKTFFFEDINAIAAGALRLLVQDIGYPTIAQALKDEKPEFRQSVMAKLPAGTREIVQQELDLSGPDRAAAIAAKTRVMDAARRLMQEGRFTLGEQK